MSLLGSLTPQQFMQEYWQKKPLLIRQAIPNFVPPLAIDDIRELATRDEVEARLILNENGQRELIHGPFDYLPEPAEPGWTALVQNVDAHDDAMAQLLGQFRFIGDARLDDAMVSIASDGGGVGPHFDSYDVFLLQAHGQRLWRISQQSDLSLVPDQALKILQNFQPEEEFLLNPGDMLYLPPHVAHDGIAVGNDCMTISIGFRAPTLAALARGVLDTAGDHLMARIGDHSGLYAEQPLPGPVLDTHYTDPDARATDEPARLPAAMVDAALEAVQKIRFDEAITARFLGHWLSEPLANAWFEASSDIALENSWPDNGHLQLDRCARIMYNDTDLFINGELAGLPPSPILRQLANQRRLPCTEEARQALNPDERHLLANWLEEGWLHYQPQ